MKAKVSIICPVYNRVAPLARAIASVKAQTFTDWELIVFDDGSGLPIRPALESVVPDWAVFHRSEQNLGAAAARNCAIAAAGGDYIAFLDSDDQWHPNYLAKQIAALEANPFAGLSYSLSRLWGRKSRSAVTTQYQIEMLLDNFIPSLSQVVVPRAAVRDRWFLPQLKVTHDREFYLRLFATHDPVCVPEVMVTRYHQGDNLTTMDDGKLWLEDGLRMFRIFYMQPENQRFAALRDQAEQNLRDRVEGVNRKVFCP